MRLLVLVAATVASTQFALAATKTTAAKAASGKVHCMAMTPACGYKPPVAAKPAPAKPAAPSRPKPY
ncbi:MAG: hypothetical protein JOZ70_06045 [Pseudolabrys sp.]|nr:hypothetical protein [Pseudolabrys sp.]MBV9954791.1 hypothetical protein [Pseudolabrys sp.]